MSIEISMSTSLDISVEQIRQAHGAELDAIARYRRVTNYLAAAPTGALPITSRQRRFISNPMCCSQNR